MKRLSIRMRVTLISGAVLTAICALVSAVILYNAQSYIIGPAYAVGGNGSAVMGATPVAPEGWIATDPQAVEEYGVSEVRISAFYITSLWGIFAVWGGGIVLIYVVTGIALKPMTRLKDEIAKTDTGDLTRRISGFCAGDELDALAASFNDMLDRTQAAFEREQSFSAGAAHELKTPLAVIKTNLDVLHLGEEPTQEEYAQTLAVVDKQVGRMTKLVDDLFAMCSLKGYEMTEQVWADRLMEEIVLEFALELEKKQLSVKKTLAPCCVCANSVMLRHALSNLVQNAVKYTPCGGHIAIAIREDGGTCVVTVADTGMGISPQAAERMFEPFYREDPSRSRKIGGAGLGLAIAKKIVEEHGGGITYQPNVPKGSVFTVTLPLK